MDTVVGFLQALPGILGPVLATLAGLITIDLAAGVAVGLRTGNFRWARVPEFYKTNVLPYGIMAIGIAAGAQFLSAEFIPAEAQEYVADLGTAVGLMPMFLNLIVGSIVPNIRALKAGKAKWEILNPEWASDDIEVAPPGFTSAGTPLPGTPPAPGDADYHLPT